ncbi:MAG: hypothetical protein HY694_14840 [Deltaproteobacteria bacterium]|nr:hypothetical protein [Deltaproteobacteria bacterium]
MRKLFFENVLATVVLAVVLALAAPMAAHALDLNTAPLPTGLSSGKVKCVVSNVSTKTGGVGARMFATDGTDLGGFGPGVPLAANATTQTDPIDLSTDAPEASYCRCTVPNKKFRCSLVHTNNGDLLEVIPGQ